MTSKIYTKTGDKGKTGLVGGKRVPKNHPRVQAYGDVDELNSHLGLALSWLPPASEFGDLKKLLFEIQSDLFVIGAILATDGPSPSPKISDSRAVALEEAIDRLTPDLKPLRHFILPGGSPAAAAFHLARTVCRRAEREVVALSSREAVPPALIIYLNRLSDLLFTVARWVNAKAQSSETPWIPEKKK